MATDSPSPQATTDSLRSEIKSVEAQIRNIEAQLKELKSRVKRLRLSVPPKTLGDLEGILAGEAQFTEEEIDAALYRVDWEGESSDEMTE
jgi:hypothetical protein